MLFYQPLDLFMILRLDLSCQFERLRFVWTVGYGVAIEELVAGLRRSASQGLVIGFSWMGKRLAGPPEKGNFCGKWMGFMCGMTGMPLCSLVQDGKLIMVLDYLFLPPMVFINSLTKYYQTDQITTCKFFSFT